MTDCMPIRGEAPDVVRLVEAYALEQFGLDGPLDRWPALRAAIGEEVWELGYDADRSTLTQSYGRPELDASLLMLPLVGFRPARDPRRVGTVAAIDRELLEDGFVRRYGGDSVRDIEGLPGGEGVFLLCSFWLADIYLLAYEDDARARRQLGNVPQAFIHVALVNTAHNLDRSRGPAQARGTEESAP